MLSYCFYCDYLDEPFKGEYIVGYEENIYKNSGMTIGASTAI